MNSNLASDKRSLVFCVSEGKSPPPPSPTPPPNFLALLLRFARDTVKRFLKPGYSPKLASSSVSAPSVIEGVL